MSIEKAYNRGDSDAYYRRRAEPHIWLDSLGLEVIEKADMSEAEIAAYWLGYEENPSGEKDWF